MRNTAKLVTAALTVCMLLGSNLPLAAGHGKGNSQHRHGGSGRGYVSVSPYGLSFGYQGRNFSVQVAPPIGRPNFVGPMVVPPYMAPDYDQGYPGFGHAGYADPGYGHTGYAGPGYYYPNVNDPGRYPAGVYGHELPRPTYPPEGETTRQPGLDQRVPGQAGSQRRAATLEPGFSVPRNELPGVPTEAQPSYAGSAEQAFRQRQYDQAVRLARHAIAEDPRNGQAQLLLSQALFATGDYRGAAEAVHQGVSQLPRSDWGYVVRNFRNYYTSSDYVEQMDRLTRFVRTHPNASYAHFLRGYHFLYLGHTTVAERELQRTLELDPNDELAAELLSSLESLVPGSDEAEQLRSRSF